MRKIQFRGKISDGYPRQGEWVYGDLCHRENLEGWRSPKLPSIVYGDLCHRENTVAISTSMVTYDVDPDTVGQFTGLCDSNGKEIYEGDLLKVHFLSKEKVMGVVTWGEGKFFIDDTFGKTKCYDKTDLAAMLARHEYKFSVCGNIHEEVI